MSGPNFDAPTKLELLENEFYNMTLILSDFKLSMTLLFKAGPKCQVYTCVCIPSVYLVSNSTGF